ncbi:BfmA/BtgA family mobilization protein, partial [Phocaeicola sp. RTP21198st1_B8_RTP21198_201120]|uniref:BfmA/BtgA family mobilization protein n=1 Tax=Phocaeicola sp. RTP21198st1_B8_RTP21198_201120 TaxID=3143217 RepID=UPI0034A20278
MKQHLDEMKGSVSSSEFIETMLSYFERNGVDPRTSINGKFKTLELQGIERIIKIIRAIEKDKIDKLLPAPEAHSDVLLKQTDKQVTQLKAEVERLKKASAPDVEDRR